jgi:hypothetical protein
MTRKRTTESAKEKATRKKASKSFTPDEIADEAKRTTMETTLFRLGWSAARIAEELDDFALSTVKSNHRRYEETGTSSKMERPPTSPSPR